MKPRRAAPTPGTFANLEAERRVLGFYLSFDGCDREAEVIALDPALFSRPEHGAVLAAMQTVARRGEPVEPITVNAVLQAQPAPPRVSLAHELALEAPPTPVPYVRILRDCGRRRQLDGALRPLYTDLATPGADLDALLADARAVLDAARDAAPVARFRLLDEAALSALPAPQFLVKDVLVEHTFTICFGAPSAGKTLVALDLALCIATGQRWHGHDVVQGPVVYLATDGGEGVPQRVTAWTEHAHRTGQLGAQFHLVRDPFDLRVPGDVDALLAAVASVPTPRCWWTPCRSARPAPTRTAPRTCRSWLPP
jgi:hypothetical protein